MTIGQLIRWLRQVDYVKAQEALIASLRQELREARADAAKGWAQANGASEALMIVRDQNERLQKLLDGYRKKPFS